MKIRNLRIQQGRYTTRAVATVIWEDCPFTRQEVYFEVLNQHAHLIDSHPDAFFVACGLPAMYYGERRIHLEEAVCPELKSGMETAIAWIHHWFQVGNPQLRLECPARDRGTTAASPQRTASFFTGGIDSWANLLQNHRQYPPSHPRRIKDLFMVFGLQYVKRANFEKAVTQFQSVGASLGVNFIPVYTNIYAYLIDGDVGHPFWQNAYNGAALAAIGHAFAQHYSVISIASGNDIPNLVPLGTHPNVDPHYSSSNLRITHDGIILSRLDKTKLVAQSNLALQNLRVCDMPELPAGKQNCGVCEKCVRTTITLDALNCLNKTKAFPYQHMTPQIADQAYVKHSGIEKIYLDLIPLLKAQRKHAVVQALKSKILRFRLEQLDQKLCGGLFFGLAKAFKSWFSQPRTNSTRREIGVEFAPLIKEN
ncbi:MAG: hypothetical protein AAF722_04240 [Cyanobacteria bacterium P01_C01_bin.70]